MTDPKQPDAAEVERVLQACADRFHEYAASHIAKGTPEGRIKARRNAEMAGMCAGALARFTIGKEHNPSPKQPDAEREAVALPGQIPPALYASSFDDRSEQRVCINGCLYLRADFAFQSYVAEQREAYARIIDPASWRARERHLERVKHWRSRPEVAGGEDLAIAFERDADAVVKPSLAKADDIIALRNSLAATPTDGALPDIEVEGERLVAETHKQADGRYLWTDVVGAVQTAISEERKRHLPRHREILEAAAKAAEDWAGHYRGINSKYLAVLGKGLQDAITEDRAAVCFAIAGNIRNLADSMNGKVWLADGPRAATPAGVEEMRTLTLLQAEFMRWLEIGPNEQPRYPNTNFRPFSTGDLKAFVAALASLRAGVGGEG